MQRWRFCSASARAQPRKDNKETTIKMVFSFPPEERVPFSQPRKDDGARVATVRAPSQLLSVRGTGQHNNQKGAIGAKERQQRSNNQNGIFFPPEERAPFSQPRIDDGVQRCGEGAFSVPQRTCDGKTQP